MRAPWSRARWLLGGGGPAAPGALARAVLWGMLAASVVLVVWAYAWIHRAEDPARTLVLASRAVDGPLALRAPLDVAWSRSVGAGGGPDDARAHLAGTLPPPVCLPNAPRLAAAVRALDDALAKGDQAGVQRALADLRALEGDGATAELVLAYNRARALSAAGDHAAAARALEPVLERHADDAAMPPANLTRARDLLARGGIDPAFAAVVYHARHLAGTIAYDRAEMAAAVTHHRRGLNALNYVIAAREGAAPAGHYQALEVDLGTHACPGAAAGLGSMDGYAALVRTYLAADGFSQPWAIRGELRRGRFDLDANDPLAPVIRYGQATAPDFEDGPIPESFLWAASNLQRVYHHNRLRPDPRLETARGVLILELAERPEWLRVLAPHGAEDACTLVRALGEGLLARAGRTPTPGPADSALAAVAVAAWGRARQECGEGADERVDAGARSRWLLLGGDRLGGGLPALYEARRRALQDALASSGSEAVVLERLETPLAQVRAELEAFASGRTPPHLPASISPDEGRAFVRAWWRALFRDAAGELLASYRGGATPTAAAAPDFLRAVNGAAAHAGMRPAELYAASELAPLARSQGEWEATRFRLRHWLLSNPLATVLLLLAVLALLWGAVLVLFVNWWRFRLLTRDRLYAGEVRMRHLAAS